MFLFISQEKLTKLQQRATFLLHCSAPSCQRVNAADRPCSGFFPSSSSSSEFRQVAAVQPDRVYRSGADLFKTVELLPEALEDLRWMSILSLMVSLAFGPRVL